MTDVTDRQTSDELTIDELARRTGMTVRNIRAHQSRGLLPPPEVRGRTGYYGTGHLARLELIREMQAEGFTLDTIKRLLERAGDSSAAVLHFTRALRAPFEDERPEVVEVSDLAEQFGSDADPKLLERAVELGVLRPLGEGRFEQPSPRLARAGDELRALGISTKTGLELVKRMRRNADGVAKAYVGLFLEHVWKTFEDEGSPEERWPEVLEALERLRPLASEALLAVFRIAMDDAVEEAMGREFGRLRERPDG